MKQLTNYCCLSLTLFLFTIKASLVTQILAPYKNFLVQGTYEGQDWSSFKQKPQSRYETFCYAFQHFVNYNGSIVVELGTSRSFTHGGLPGCNSNDSSFWTPNNPENWDWGAGFFTRMACECLITHKALLHTVDIAQDHINRCKLMTAPFAPMIRYHVCSSVDFLNNIEDKIDLLYVDTGDMTPLEPTALLQLEEAKVVVERDLIKHGGLILIDDIKNQTPKKFGETSDLGKGKYSIPYLLSHGFELIMDEYQVILQKK